MKSITFFTTSCGFTKIIQLYEFSFGGLLQDLKRLAYAVNLSGKAKTSNKMGNLFFYLLIFFLYVITNHRHHNLAWAALTFGINI